MTMEERRFLDEMLRALRGELGEMRRDILGLGIRMTAMEQQIAGLHTNMVGLQHSIDGLTVDMRRVKQRLELVEK